MGVIFLYNNQERHYLDYFFLLLSFWEYMPKDNEINNLKIFIKKFYKKDIYLKIFDTAVIKIKFPLKIFKNIIEKIHILTNNVLIMKLNKNLF